MVKKVEIAPVEWLSEKAEWQETNDPDFVYKVADFYTKFKFKNITAGVNDFVLISNYDAAEPDTVEGCDIAQIIKLYESHDQDLCDRYRAHVRWFCRASDVPASSLKNTDIELDKDLEVVEDHRPFDKDVSIETFFKSCQVLKVPTSTAVSQMARNSSKIITFVCRYQLVGIGRKKYTLQPILEEERKEFCSKFENLAMTPKSKIKENISLNKTPNSLIKKFAATSLNDNRPWIIKNTEPSKLVLMRDITNKVSHSDSKDKSVNKRRSTTKHTNVSPPKMRNVLDRDIADLLESDEEIEIRDNVTSSAKRVLNFESKLKKPVRHSYAPTSSFKENELSTRRSTRVSKVNVKYAEDSVDSDEMKSVVRGLNLTPFRKSNKTESIYATPKRSKVTTRYSESSDSEFESTEKTNKKGKSATNIKTPKQLVTPGRKIKTSQLTPSIHSRHNPVILKEGGLQKARESLHVSAVPLSLPCREEEFNNIFTFIEGKISDNSGGCMYISGVPGTGKTATVTEVIRCLNKRVKQSKLPNFEFIEINGMRLTEPRQAYVHIYRQLTGKTVAWEQACNLLEARFTKPAPRRTTTVLLIDELDILCNRRQDVLYNLLDWPTHSAAHLVVVAIANTMDLPERLLMGRVASRMGLTRLTFQPYTFTQLQSIVTARLSDTGAFKSDAVQLVVRKVAAVSGDARRALDICRRAVELAELSKGEQVGLGHVNQALTEMIASPKVQAIKSCSKMEQFFLQATVAEVQRTGIEETTLQMIYKQLESICAFVGLRTPTVTEAFGICCRLGSCRLLITEHSRNDIYAKVLLNVSLDDVHYATQKLISL